ncbi:MAG TPA: type II secretion system protein GspN, partial [Minicystis sp.]|nr:type II secretion system protein GspN [Minicystis sp.]
MKDRLVRVAKLLAYPAFYLFCLALFGYLAFPYSRLKDRLVAEFDRRAGRSGQRLEIEHVSSYWFSGVEATGIRLVIPRKEEPSPFKGVGATDDAAKPKENVIAIDEAHVRVRILPLLIGRVRLSFWASGMGGEISGVMPIAGSNGDISVQLEKVDIGKIEPLVSAIGGIPLRGAASGKIELAPEDGKLSRSTGTIELTVNDVVVSDGKTKIQGLIELPAARLGDLMLTAQAKDGVLKIDKLQANGADLELVGDGKVGLHDNWQNSVADLFVRFKFTDAYRGKNDLTKTLLGAPGSSVPALIDTQVPKLKRAKRADGFYGFHAHGPLKRLQFDPSSEGGAASATGPGLKRHGDSPFNRRFGGVGLGSPPGAAHT